MYCHDCGTANTVDSKYCKECGGKINDGYRTMMLSVQDIPLDQSEEKVDQLTRLLDMAFWHNEAGNIEAAVTASEAALAINPNSTTAHSLLGTLYEKKGDDAQAIAHFESVLALNPESMADAAKLDQLRRGVHVKAAAPPISHQFVPPALLKLGPVLRQKWTAVSAASLKTNSVQRRPLFAAGAVTGVVLLAGLLLMRPWAQADSVRTYPVVPSAPPPVPVNNSGYSGGTASVPSTAALLPPVVMTGSTISTVPVLTSHDPFAGRVPSSLTGPSPRWSLPPVPTRTASTRRRRSDGESIPPLRLAALPPVGSEGLAPAPITLPAGLTAAPVSVASVPQHTVVVNSLGGGQPGDNSVPYNPSSQSAVSSHIHITVHEVSDPGSNSASNSASASPSGGGSNGRGDADQQRALSLQQGGDFQQARAVYQSAIHAYEAQIASGHDVETAQRGLAACQTGLQICQQSE